MNRTRNVLWAGLGGQGVLKASEMCAVALFKHGYVVKESAVHGMSQRGGGVTSQVRFGRVVYSMLIPEGAVDFLVAMGADEGERQRPQLRSDGIFLTIADCLGEAIGPGVMANTVMLGRLAAHLDVPVDTWREAIAECVKPEFVAINLHSLDVGLAFEGRRS